MLGLREVWVWAVRARCAVPYSGTRHRAFGPDATRLRSLGFFCKTWSRLHLDIVQIRRIDVLRKIRLAARYAT